MLYGTEASSFELFESCFRHVFDHSADRKEVSDQLVYEHTLEINILVAESQ